LIGVVLYDEHAIRKSQAVTALPYLQELEAHVSYSIVFEEGIYIT
jgi:hypothetical protein